MWIHTFSVERNRRRSTLAGTRAVLGVLGIVLALAFVSPSGMAAPVPVPGIAKGVGKVETTTNAPDDVRKELEAARRELSAVEAVLRRSPGTDAGIEGHVEQQRYLLREMVRAYEQTLAAKERIELAQKLVDEAQKQADSWAGFETLPPYSVLFVDKLIKDADAAERRVKASDGEYQSFNAFREQLTRAIQANAAAIRREEERQSGSNSGVEGNAREVLDLMRLRARAQTAVLKELESSGEKLRLDVVRTGIEAKLARRKADTARADVHFPLPDYHQVRNELDAESRDASTNLAKLLGETGVAESKQLAAREEALRDARVPAVTSGGMLDALRLLPTVIEIKRGAWDLRYSIYNDRSPALLADAAQRQSHFLKTLELFASNVERQLVRSGEVAGRLESLLIDADASGLRQTLRMQLEDSIKRRKYLQDTAAAVASAQFIVARLGEELGVSKASMGMLDRMKTMANNASEMAGKLWDFELFTAENTIEVDGRKVTGISSITIGKIARAVLIFAVGVFATLWLGRVAESYVVGRFGYDATRARILRKWLFTLGLLILLVVVLTWVNIPLSVFAFLGGAVAIGVGFGMQTLLKNLISGLMLLFEQPFKPGDLVQVGDIKGNITEVGIRSSVIRDANGIETLVPNSVFLEQNVTNWMYENPRVRFCIRLGVAYGSPAREVAEILDECVRRHGLVLHEPAPMVLFEDFGADALQFAVYYWVEIGAKANPVQIASDLRFMIDKALSDKGVVISFPQRDVHLDAASPLKIEVVRNRNPAPVEPSSAG